MANLKIVDLHPVGSLLFQDPENFLNELADRDAACVTGGIEQYNVQVSTQVNGIGQSGFAMNIQVSVTLDGSGTPIASVAFEPQSAQVQTLNFAQSFINA